MPRAHRIHRIGLIADTHGLIRPECVSAFDGVEMILHAGDVGGSDVLAALRTVAPVHAVSGNMDPPGQPDLTGRIAITVGGLDVHVSHGHELGQPEADRLLARYSARILVFGHTHRPVIVRSGDRLVVNPGAAGPRRFNLQPSVGLLTIRDGHAEAEIVTLRS